MKIKVEKQSFVHDSGSYVVALCKRVRMTLGALSLACLDGIEPFFQKAAFRRITRAFFSEE
nr:MAG TPA: hypothetical protein [Caudoviricetes sp.]